jgi:hypothetical protein
MSVGKVRSFRFADAILIAVLLCISILMGVHMGRSRSGSTAVAEIEIGGKTAAEYVLKKGEPLKQIAFQIPRGTATVEIKDGRIRILPLPNDICPAHICSATGWIERPGQFIACVPNRLLITIHSTRSTASDSLDGLTY